MVCPTTRQVRFATTVRQDLIFDPAAVLYKNQNGIRFGNLARSSEVGRHVGKCGGGGKGERRKRGMGNEKWVTYLHTASFPREDPLL